MKERWVVDGILCDGSKRKKTREMEMMEMMDRTEKNDDVN